MEMESVCMLSDMSLVSDVLIVLVTDCLVLLTEKDQKLNIASLLDSKVCVHACVCVCVCARAQNPV